MFHNLSQAIKLWKYVLVLVLDISWCMCKCWISVTSSLLHCSCYLHLCLSRRYWFNHLCFLNGQTDIPVLPVMVNIVTCGAVAGICIMGRGARQHVWSWVRVTLSSIWVWQDAKWRTLSKSCTAVSLFWFHPSILFPPKGIRFSILLLPQLMEVVAGESSC